MNKIDTGIAELLAKQPSDSAEKDAYIAELQKTVRLLTDEVRNMDELLALLRKKQFAPSSEQTKPTEGYRLSYKALDSRRNSGLKMMFLLLNFSLMLAV